MIKLTDAMRLQLVEAARDAMKNAYAPYSRFRVGSAVLLDNGEVVSGCNVENASYGMTSCAERNAVFTAIRLHGPKIRILAAAVVNDKGAPCSPCGACRQVLFEHGEDARIVFQGLQGMKESGLRELLPEGFRLAGE